MIKSVMKEVFEANGQIYSTRQAAEEACVARFLDDDCGLDISDLDLADLTHDLRWIFQVAPVEVAPVEAGIREGWFYRTRNGDQIGPMGRNSVSDDQPWRGVMAGYGFRDYENNGNYYSGLSSSDLDLDLSTGRPG